MVHHFIPQESRARAWVARKTNDAATLIILAADRDATVRAAAIDNDALPVTALDLLIADQLDPWGQVHARAAKGRRR